MNFTKRQIEIITSASNLIGEKGIQNLTTKNLAAKMAFSEPALYRHFKGKTEILKSVLLFYKQVLSNGLISIIKSDKSALTKLNTIIEFQFKHFTENPAIIMVIFSETSFQYNSILSGVVSKIMVQKEKMLTEIIIKGQESGELRTDISAQQLATILMGSMRLTVLRWRLSNFEFDLEKEGAALWSTIELIMKKN